MLHKSDSFYKENKFSDAIHIYEQIFKKIRMTFQY